jgi:hypothetical protein
MADLHRRHHTTSDRCHHRHHHIIRESRYRRHHITADLHHRLRTGMSHRVEDAGKENS